MKRCGFIFITLLSLSLYGCGGDGGGMLFLPSDSGGGTGTIPTQTITLTLDTQEISLGSGVTHNFSATVSDYTGTLLYQWFVNDVLQAGINCSSFSFMQDTAITDQYTISVRAYADGVEGFSGINAMVYGSQPNTTALVDLGSIMGDYGTDIVTHMGKGDAFLKIQSKEILNYVGPFTSNVNNIKTKIGLTPGNDADYDLAVFSDEALTDYLSLEETRGNGAESTSFSIADDYKCIISGMMGSCTFFSDTDQSTDYYIWVKCHEDTGGNDWTLTVSGNAQ
ncbi:MAG: hypothetical protein JXA20_20360 [Spirochaetes bacterium]|nr:hypothetical protein [Spirochaetota bacterium]